MSAYSFSSQNLYRLSASCLAFITCAHCDNRYSAVTFCTSIQSPNYRFIKLKSFYYSFNSFKVIVLHFESLFYVWLYLTLTMIKHIPTITKNQRNETLSLGSSCWRCGMRHINKIPVKNGLYNLDTDELEEFTPSYISRIKYRI